MPEKIFVALSIALALTAPLVSDAQKTFPRKKLIEVGWDQPDTKLLRANYRQMEATAPFDGVVYVVKFNADGKSYDENKILQASPWKREWLAEPLADLKACRFTRFADNFIRVNTAPGDLKWDDEAAWAGASANMGHLAWFAKQSGSKGVCFDPECYSAPQYRWKPENGLSFEKTSEFARKRGAQIMRAMSKENPSFTFFAFWLLSLNSQNANAPDPSPSLRSEQYGLWPSFVAGLLEAAPSTVKFVDATENGYHPDDRNGYLSLYSLCRGANSPLRKLLPDHLREKYNRQVSVGFGFYLDRYLNRPSDKYYIAPLPGGTSLERLGINLEAAMEIADEYVWAYGEQSRWWKPLGVSSDWVDVNLKNTVGKGRLWEEAMPGITLALDALRDPDSSLREAAKRRSPERNLAINPNFDEEKPKGGSESEPRSWTGKTARFRGFRSGRATIQKANSSGTEPFMRRNFVG